MRMFFVIGVGSFFLFLIGQKLAAEGLSETNRGNRTAYAALEAIGLTALPVSGVRAAYCFTHDLIGEAGSATGSVSMGDWKYDKKILSVKAKYFFANSFYVDAGLGMEIWNTSYRVVNDGSGADSQKLTADLSNVGVEFHIGNQWQWDGFTLGCDWIGGFAAVSNSSSFGSAEGLNQDDKKTQ